MLHFFFLLANSYFTYEVDQGADSLVLLISKQAASIVERT